MCPKILCIRTQLSLQKLLVSDYLPIAKSMISPPLLVALSAVNRQAKKNRCFNNRIYINKRSQCIIHLKEFDNHAFYLWDNN